MSTISRADSEWPLSLVDFRSVLELQIKETFKDLVQKYIDKKNYSLANIARELEANKMITGDMAFAMHGDMAFAMHQIRISGNAATHQLKTFDYDDNNYCWDDFNEDDSENLNYLLKILKFFNTYNKEHNIQFPK